MKIIKIAMAKPKFVNDDGIPLLTFVKMVRSNAESQGVGIYPGSVSALFKNFKKRKDLMKEFLKNNVSGAIEILSIGVKRAIEKNINNKSKLGFAKDVFKYSIENGLSIYPYTTEKASSFSKMIAKNEEFLIPFRIDDVKKAAHLLDEKTSAYETNIGGKTKNSFSKEVFQEGEVLGYDLHYSNYKVLSRILTQGKCKKDLLEKGGEISEKHESYIDLFNCWLKNDIESTLNLLMEVAEAAESSDYRRKNSNEKTRCQFALSVIEEAERTDKELAYNSHSNVQKLIGENKKLYEFWQEDNVGASVSLLHSLIKDIGGKKSFGVAVAKKVDFYENKKALAKRITDSLTENIEAKKHHPVLHEVWSSNEDWEVKVDKVATILNSFGRFPPNPNARSSSDFRPSVHTEGGESRSWHEVVIRDIFFFTGTNFIYEPQKWWDLHFVKGDDNEGFKSKCFGEAKTYNEDYLAERQEKDPNYVMPHKPYETTYPQPDFLINNTTLFEVFGGSPEMEKYEISMGFKKKKFTEFFSNHFAYIDKKPLDSAALNDRTLMSYAISLDTKVEGAKSSIGNQFQSKLETIAPLLGENNIHLNVNYRTQISSFSEDERISTKYNVDIYNHGEYPTDKDVKAPIPFEQLPKAIAPEQTEASNDSWYKLAQSSGYNRTEPASMNEISSALKQEGFWSSHRWSENDRIAMYFKTPENLQMALSKLQQPIMEFPQQEQQIAAFNLSRMKK